MPLIKRYANRKLYDTETRRYVTLDDIADMVRRGEEVTVQAHETGADITTTTLLQVIFEQERRIGGMLPGLALDRLLRGGETAISSLRQGVQALLDPCQYVDDGIRQRLKRLTERGDITPAEEERLAALLLDPGLVQVEPAPEVGLEDIERLQEQVTRLEEQIAALIEEKGSS